MHKTVVIINGSGGVGKDTICDIVANLYPTMSVSSVVIIKEIARRYGGWKGIKDARSRKFLSDLKALFSDYNDLPFKELQKDLNDFIHSNYLIMFAHIREDSEVEKFAKYVQQCGISCIKLLILRQNTLLWGNEADDNINPKNYDTVFHNDGTLEELPLKVANFFKNMLNSTNGEHT